MLRLRSCLLPKLVCSPSTSPISSLRRLLSAAAPPVPPNPSFAVEDYLVDTCGLTRAQALRASPRLSHLKSPSKPDAVLAFLAGLGFSSADVSALVVKDPRFLCAGVERTLAPIVVGLTGLGISRSEVARLVSVAPGGFRLRSVVSKLQYYLTLFGSAEILFHDRVVKYADYLLTPNFDRVVKPNVAFLQECGLGACDIAKLCIRVPRMLVTDPGRVRSMVACAEGVGVPRGSGMFRLTLQAVAFLSEEKITTKIEYLKKTFRWSDAEVGIAVCKTPMLLMRSKDTLQSKSEFLISEVGLEPAYIAHRPTMLTCSLEGRLRPRYYVVEFLKANGLPHQDLTYCTIIWFTDKVFVEKFICPHKEAAPHLAEDYAAACRGEVPTRFIFARTKTCYENV